MMTETSDTQHVYDVVIVGAGPGGSTTAYYLAREGLDVLIVDKASFPRDKTCGDALTPRAVRALDEMGLTDDVLSRGARHSRVDFFSPAGQVVGAGVRSRDGQYDFVQVVPRLELDHLLLQHAIASGARFEPHVRVMQVGRDDGGVLVTTESGKRQVEFRARMAVVATGASPALLLRMGLLKQTPQVILCSRAYFEGIADIEAVIQCRFDSVPLPGYGWIFPLSATRANVGIGIFRYGLARLWMPSTARAAFDGFVASPAVRRVLGDAKPDGPIKGFPIRVDFARAPTHGERVLLVGEAAGLVNPVTGEGIDYAIESGKIAADHLAVMFAAGDFSPKRLHAYDAQLRGMYQRLFVLSDWLRLLYSNPFVVSRALRAAGREPRLRDLYMDIIVENLDPMKGLVPNTLVEIARG
jgi:menaquinone-9 beta-reductase